MIQEQIALSQPIYHGNALTIDASSRILTVSDLDITPKIREANFVDF